MGGRYYFFFNDTATTEIYTLSLHDALPIYRVVVDRMQLRDDAIELIPDLAALRPRHARQRLIPQHSALDVVHEIERDRKSTRLNSSHANISYAVFCLKKKNTLAISPTPASS